MSELPIVYLARHGETAWTVSGRHTGRTDLPLTERGERNARALGKRLEGLKFIRVFTSSLQRASRTCELARFGALAKADPDLVEWNYGDYEGLTAAQIHANRPDWQFSRDGFPGCETFDEIQARADCVVSRTREIHGAVLLFSSAHFLRVLGSRWLGLNVAAALAVAPVQDLLNLGGDARMNVPGQAAGNWRRRLTDDLLPAAAFDGVASLTRESGRCPVDTPVGKCA